MATTTNLHSEEAIEKLKKLVSEINICLFCTNLKVDKGATCRPMSAQQTDEEGNIWFFSSLDSDKNREIEEDVHVQLFFAHPDKSSYLVVNGEAEIINDQNKIEELWSPLLKTWFTDGKNDASISLIKVNAKTAYYWDTDGNKMINFLKMVASAATGTSLTMAKQGKIEL
jgi:general stress protein 26